MSINRVDYQGALLRTTDFSQIKQAEDNRPHVEQQMMNQSFEKQVQAHSDTIVQPEKATQNQEKFDAKEKGKNKYYNNNKKNPPRKQHGILLDNNGKPLHTDMGSGFDFTV